ncbi:MAG: glycosyltransferase [Clostridia bacterium]|nr:glycosyltransferase [Clostridia bacterium]
MKSVLFLIPTLGGGGAEKVLVNLANNLNKSKYTVTVQTIFKGGVHTSKLNRDITYLSGKSKAFRGNVRLFKFFSPQFLYKRIVKKRYDIVVAYLEGVACRIVSGCPYTDSKLVGWIHREQKTKKVASYAFRSEKEMNRAYNRFDKIVCVADTVKHDFESLIELKKNCVVLYNTNETDEIYELEKEGLGEFSFSKELNLISVGRLVSLKGFDRLINIHKKLLDKGVKNHLYILGTGQKKCELEYQIKTLNVENSVHLLGFQENPYKYIANADLFICSSKSEGFSTAVTEALIVGTPVVSTNCSGAYELLGGNNEYGIVVKQDEEDLLQAVYYILTEEGALAYYKRQAQKRGAFFSKEKTVVAVENMLDSL